MPGVQTCGTQYRGLVFSVISLKQVNTAIHMSHRKPKSHVPIPYILEWPLQLDSVSLTIQCNANNALDMIFLVYNNVLQIMI